MRDDKIDDIKSFFHSNLVLLFCFLSFSFFLLLEEVPISNTTLQYLWG